QKRVIDQNGRSPSSFEKAKIRCGMTDHLPWGVNRIASAVHREHLESGEQRRAALVKKSEIRDIVLVFY
ncbi:hypothetical protein, partial [Aeromonas veronii]|uniref:hypothetical protein n=1 Tax=Aeromonas veronii TaxID=654 RepID=UPI003D1E72BD